MLIAREQFESAAVHFIDCELHPDLYNKRLERRNGDLFARFSLDKAVEGEEPKRIDVTIAFSCVYSAPQIFFRVLSSNGGLLNDPAKVMAILPGMRTDGVGAYALPIGFEQDPCDGLASFFIHPCRVGDIMGELEAIDTRHYLVSYWNLYHL